MVRKIIQSKQGLRYVILMLKVTTFKHQRIQSLCDFFFVLCFTSNPIFTYFLSSRNQINILNRTNRRLLNNCLCTYSFFLLSSASEKYSYLFWSGQYVLIIYSVANFHYLGKSLHKYNLFLVLNMTSKYFNRSFLLQKRIKRYTLPSFNNNRISFKLRTK